MKQLILIVALTLNLASGFAGYGWASGSTLSGRMPLGFNSPTVHGPSAVQPGGRVRISLSGFTPGSRVQIQFGVYFEPVRNCCVSAIFPRYPHAGILIGPSGRRTLVVKMARRWAQCVAASCPTPDWHPYRAGQRVYIAAFNSTDSQYAQHLARVAPG